MQFGEDSHTSLPDSEQVWPHPLGGSSGHAADGGKIWDAIDTAEEVWMKCVGSDEPLEALENTLYPSRNTPEARVRGIDGFPSRF